MAPRAGGPGLTARSVPASVRCGGRGRPGAGGLEGARGSADGDADGVGRRRSKAGVVAIACASSSWAQELDGRRDYWVGELARRRARRSLSAAFGSWSAITHGPIDRLASAPRRAPMADELASAAAQTPQHRSYETLRGAADSGASGPNGAGSRKKTPAKSGERSTGQPTRLIPCRDTNPVGDRVQHPF